MQKALKKYLKFIENNNILNIDVILKHSKGKSW